MKLMRFGPPGEEQPFVSTGADTVLPVGDLIGDFDAEFFRTGGLEFLRHSLATVPDVHHVAPIASRVGPPIASPSKIVCVGLNYMDHVAESGAEVPTEPVIFLKAPNTIVGPYDDVHIPRGSEKTDYEVELGIVIGRQCRYLDSTSDALGAVAGYVVSNDVSERAFQLERGGQWDKGKSCETFNPIGPWLVTPDEVDASELTLWLNVNGETRQRGSTGSMIFPAAELIRYVSQFMVLEPGDLLNTGTPAGVALGMKEPSYLRPNDVVELGISALGSQRQRLVPAP